jgi:hypothetical protein
MRKVWRSVYVSVESVLALLKDLWVPASPEGESVEDEMCASRYRGRCGHLCGKRGKLI